MYSLLGLKHDPNNSWMHYKDPLISLVFMWGDKIWVNTYQFLSYCFSAYCFPCGSDNKEPACHARDLVQPLGQEDPLEKGMTTHSSILAWEIYGQKSLASYGPWGCKDLDSTERLTHITFFGRSLIFPILYSTNKSFAILLLNNFRKLYLFLNFCCLKVDIWINKE